MTVQVYLQNKQFEKIPKTYIECTKDNVLTIEAQRAMYGKYSCHVVSLPTDHSPFLSAPEDLIRLLMTFHFDSQI